MYCFSFMYFETSTYKNQKNDYMKKVIKIYIY